MKTRKHKLQDSILLVLFLLALVALGYGLFLFLGKGSEGAVEAAVPEEADAVLYINFQAMSQSAFGRAMAEGDAEEFVSDDFSEFLESLGLTQDDVVEGLFAVRDLSALQEDRLPQAGLSGALRLSARVTLSQIEAALRETLEDDADAIRQSTLGERSILEFPAPDMGVTLQMTAFEREDGGTTLYFGDANALRATVAKLESRREKSLPANIRDGKEAMLPDSHTWLVVLISPQMQSSLRELIGAAPFPLGPAGDAIASLNRTGLSLQANQALAVQVALTFASAEHATTVQGFMNENILPMFQMMAAGQGDNAPGFLRGLRAEAHDDTVSLTASVSAADARRMGEAIIVETAPPPEPEPTTPAQQPGTVTTQPDAQTGPPSWPVLRVQTVLLSSNEAVINGELYEVGDEFDGVTLHQVANDGVVLRLDREYRFVAVGDSTEDQ